MLGCQSQWSEWKSRLQNLANHVIERSERKKDESSHQNKENRSQSNRLSRAERSRANAELLRELFLVVLNRTPKNRAQFGNWLDTLNQGASLEGVYNGFVSSEYYRKLELQGGGASPEELQRFGKVVARLQLEKADRTLFTADDLRPRSSVNLEQMRESLAVEEQTFGLSQSRVVQPKVNLRDLDFPQLASFYSRFFIGASFYTLKRVAGEEALKVLAHHSDYPEKRAIWYSKWVNEMSRFGVDFGLSLRNKVDEDFHYRWAMQANSDQITWEVLNRVHRVINSRP